jgi:hypothetical protein
MRRVKQSLLTPFRPFELPRKLLRFILKGADCCDYDFGINSSAICLFF